MSDTIVIDASTMLLVLNSGSKGGGWGCTSTELQGWWVGLHEYRATRVVGGAARVQSYKGGGLG